MTEKQKARKLLQHMVNTNQVDLRDVYALIMERPILSRMYRQSEWLHDNFPTGDLNYIAHLYMTDPNRN